MKNAIKFLGLIGLVAVIGFSISACGEGPEGPQGQDGKDGTDGQNGKDGTDGQNGLPGSNSVRVVDSTNREVCIVITTGSSTYISISGYTFYGINLTSGEISRQDIFATGPDGSGTIFGGNYVVFFPNYIYKTSTGEYYRAKNRDASGYANAISARTAQSFLSYSSITWSSSTASSDATAELEKITAATADSYFFGFTPTLPLRYAW
jgi:hypothetical protein